MAQELRRSWFWAGRNLRLLQAPIVFFSQETEQKRELSTF